MPSKYNQFLTIIFIIKDKRSNVNPKYYRRSERGEIPEALSHHENFPCKGRIEHHCLKAWHVSLRQAPYLLF